MGYFLCCVLISYPMSKIKNRAATPYILPHVSIAQQGTCRHGVYAIGYNIFWISSLKIVAVSSLHKFIATPFQYIGWGASRKRVSQRTRRPPIIYPLKIALALHIRKYT